MFTSAVTELICKRICKYFLGWVHTRNLTVYRKAVTLQVTDTIRSYELKFHPVPHGVKNILRALHSFDETAKCRQDSEQARNVTAITNF